MSVGSQDARVRFADVVRLWMEPAAEGGLPARFGGLRFVVSAMLIGVQMVSGIISWVLLLCIEVL
jgi:hypothetical protein